MNTKNIILGLSLILSSVATLNLTSCSDDDDDDANHAPKSEVVENNMVKATIEAAKVAKDTIKTQLGLDVKSYVATKFVNQYQNLAVTETSEGLTVRVLTSWGNETQQQEFISDLGKTLKENADVFNLIKAVHPTVRVYSSQTAASSPDAYYSMTYKF